MWLKFTDRRVILPEDGWEVGVAGTREQHESEDESDDEDQLSSRQYMWGLGQVKSENRKKCYFPAV